MKKSKRKLPQMSIETTNGYRILFEGTESTLGSILDGIMTGAEIKKVEKIKK